MADVPVLVPNAEGGWVWEWRVPTGTPGLPPRILCSDAVPDAGPVSFRLLRLLAMHLSTVARPVCFSAVYTLPPRLHVAPGDRAIRAVVKAWKAGGWNVGVIPYMRGADTLISFSLSHPHTAASVLPAPPVFPPSPARVLNM